MAKLKNSPKEEVKNWKRGNNAGAQGAIYGLGFVGAVVYYIQHATTFMAGVVGILKAIVWPAFFVYKAIELLKI